MNFKARGPSLLLAALLATLSGGCASPVPEHIAQLRSARSCCAGISTLPLLGRLEAQPISFELSQQSPAFDFPEGRSHFAAIELPPRPASAEAKRMLELNTWRRGSGGSSAYVFCPLVTALDAQRKVLGPIDIGVLNPRGAGYTAYLEVPPEAAFLVVHTAGEDLGQRTLRPGDPRPGVVMVGNNAFMSPVGGGARSACGPQGALTLTLRTY